MNSIKQYRPHYFEGFPVETVEFTTTAELLAIPWVARFAEPPEIASEPFHQFSISPPYLMAEYADGAVWWVVGFIKDPVAVDLPPWDSDRALRMKAEKAGL